MVCTDTRMNRWPRTAFGQFTIPSNRTSSLPLVHERLKPRLAAFSFRETEAGPFALFTNSSPVSSLPFSRFRFELYTKRGNFREPCKFHGTEPPRRDLSAVKLPLFQQFGTIVFLFYSGPSVQFSFEILSRFRIRLLYRV